MAQTIADRVAEGRRRGFVGRRSELAVFDALLAAPDHPAVLFVTGPAGVGKTTLLHRFAADATEAGAFPLTIDARDLPPVAEAVASAFGAAAGLPGRAVILLDHYELLAELDARIRDEWAPGLPSSALLVLGGQLPPAPGWRTDPGWSSLVRSVRLANLGPDDARSLLTRKGVPEALHPSAIEFTHGHPLALALVGEVVREKGVLTTGDSQDVVAVLITRLLAAVPSRAHRAALEAAAQVRVLDEPMLAALLDQPDCGELFDWMRQLPFVDAGPFGLYLHDLARDALAADLRWRHPQQYAALHQRARDQYLARLERPDPGAQAAALLDLIYLHPELRQFLQAPAAETTLRVEPLRAADVDAAVGIVVRHEGDESAGHARRWLDEQPQRWLVVREGDAVAGLLCLLPIENLSADDPDPAVVAAVRRLHRHPSLRPGETATLIRFWMSRDVYQSVCAVQSLIATQLARHYLTTTGLAVSILPFAHPDQWVDFCAYADQHPAPEADFDVGGRRYTAFDHDWRVVPPAAWVAQLSIREVGGVPAAGPPAPAGAVLSETEFAAAVRRALQSITRPDRLRSNPLLQSRFVSARAGEQASVPQRVAALQTALTEAAETLAAVPADRRLHRVLVRAYLSPAPSLERAAEVLDLPSSTFRRLLGTAVGRVTAVLWHAELDG